MAVTSEGFTLKVGLPCYLNTLPLLHYLKPFPGLEVKLLPPFKINRLLESGELDAGLGSSLFYARNFRKFLILPDLSISAVGRVKSVLLYHQVPLEELEDKPLGITPETETSFGLLRIVLEEFYQVFPRYEVLASPLSEGGGNPERDLAGYLAIGDEALFLQRLKIFPLYTDLAEVWLEKTNLPFVFALFVVRVEVAKERGKILRDFLREIYFSRAKGLSQLDSLIKDYPLHLERDFALNYLKHLEYDFSGLKQRAFLHFCELLLKKGLLETMPELNFFPL